MLRLLLLTVPLLLVLSGRAQGLEGDSTAALSFNRSVNVPLNVVQIHDRATEAWTWTFGKEPGAKLVRTDREAGVIEGVARVNFRSSTVSMREESMGVIQYRVMIHIRPGECRITVTELTHSGNRNTARGGIHLGLLTRSILPPVKVPGAGRSNAMRLYADMKEQASTRVNAVLQAFTSRLRASAEE